MTAKYKFTPLHVTITAVLFLFVELFNQGVSSFLNFNSDYVFWFLIFVALIGFVLGLSGGSK